LALNISFGFGLAMGIIVSGNISGIKVGNFFKLNHLLQVVILCKGGHLNPAVSFAFLLKGKLSLVRFIVYVFAQNIGAFTAAVMVYLTYLYELTIFKEGMYSLKTAGNLRKKNSVFINFVIFKLKNLRNICNIS